MTTIAFPTLSRRTPGAVEFGLKANTQVFTSPLNGSVQTLALPGARWTAAFTWANLAEADAALLQAFLAQLRGQANFCALYPYHRSVPRGSIALSGVTLNGAVAQFASTANLANCGASKTLQAGDYFAVAGELKIATAAATADGSGNMTGVTFEPPVRASAGWSNGAGVTTNKPTATFMLSDPHARWATRVGTGTDIAFDLVEVFQ